MCNISHIAQRVKKSGKIAWDRAFEFQKFTADRVRETQGFGVKSLSFKGICLICPGGGARQFAPSAIGGIADQSVADISHVHADLMGAAGFEFATNQCCVVAECFSYTSPGHGVSATL